MNVPFYLLPRHLVSVLVYAGTWNISTGVVTWATPVDLAMASGTQTFEAFEWSSDPIMARVEAADSGQALNMIEMEDWTATLRERPVNNGITACGVIASSANYIKVEALYRKPGATTGGGIVTVAGVRGNFSGSIARGNNPWSLTIKPGLIGGGLAISYS